MAFRSRHRCLHSVFRADDLEQFFYRNGRRAFRMDNLDPYRGYLWMLFDIVAVELRRGGVKMDKSRLLGFGLCVSFGLLRMATARTYEGYLKIAGLTGVDCVGV